MTGRYGAFTFCDRITEYVPAQHARARFAIPAGIAAFPSCLVAEATGQLAAWVAMANVDFRGRPVAALAGQTHYLREVNPGETLELAIDIEHCDDETVAYSGRAMVGSETVLELADCVGPMLPQDVYDSAEDLAAEFALLSNGGVPPGRFGGVPTPMLETLEDVPGTRRHAKLQVPSSAPYFADHFPRLPVFPATLMLDAALRVATSFVNATPPGTAKYRPARVTNVKMRAFTLPGQTIEIEIEPLAATGAGPRLSVTARHAERTVATAHAEFVAES